MRNLVKIVLIASALVVGSQPALAEGLEEITVTAQRRAQSLQDVPASVTAVNEEAIRAFNINDSGRLELVTPGLVWGNQGGSRAWPTLRGVETGNGEANGEPSIAFFIDGVYKSRSMQANAPLVDVERVEVLRGPQGTLFGRNSTGGAINVVNKSPDLDDTSFMADVTVGNYNNIKLDAVLNTPLNDKWALRIAARSHTRDGFLENIGPGPDFMDEDLAYGRVSLLYDSGEALSAQLRIGYRKVDRNGGGAFTAKVLGQTYDTSIPGRSVFGDPVFINPRISDGIPDITVAGTPTDVGVPVQTDPFTIDTNFPVSEELDSLDMSLDISYEMDSMTFRSLTGYADFESLPVGDNDYSSQTAILNRADILSGEAQTLQQEFQLISNGDGPFDWVVGLFYMQDEIFEIFSIQQFDASNTPSPVFPSPAGGTTSFVFDRRTTTEIDSLAVYGQGTFNLSDRLSATVGLRWSEDDKDYTLREFGFLGVLGFNPDLDLNNTFDDVTWRAGLEYAASDDSMWYGSISTGFRSGGFNRFTDDPATPNNETVFDSEEITAYEIGTKNTLLDGRMRLNVAAFFQELKDQQVSTVVSVAGTGQSGFFNAGETEVSGLEAEMQFQATDNFYLMGTLTLLDAEYKEFLASGFAGDGGTVDVAGNAPQRAPETKLTLAGAYEIGLDGGATVTPFLAIQYSGDYYNTFFNTPIDKQDSYTKLDARVTYLSSDEKWRVEGFVENATEEEVQTYGVFGGSNAYFVNYDAPRTYGIRVTYQN